MNLTLKFTTDLVSNLSVTIMRSEMKENQPTKKNNKMSACKIIESLISSRLLNVLVKALFLYMKFPNKVK